MEQKNPRGQSLQTKITMLTAFAIVAAMIVATVIGIFAVKNIGNSSSEQLLLLLCETGEKNLDAYFESVEQSVEMVSGFVKSDIDGLDQDKLADHIDRVRDIFGRTANKTHGVLTYYYRIDPSISNTVKGFWYTDLDGTGFVEHEVTDITQYDTTDTSALVWFTMPKATGKAIWLSPYITDNLDMQVISYNVPIYWQSVFVGVVGIEIDYSTMAEQVNNIKLYNNGYALISDDQGAIVYHPHIDILTMPEESRPTVPDGMLSTSTFIRYKYDGVEKQAVWLPLSNGMRLVVTVPVSEINGDWQRLIVEIVIAFVVLLAVFVFLTLSMTSHLTKPLLRLTEAAEQINAGNYDVRLDYNGNDEIGILTRTVNRLIRNLKGYISDLNSLAYGDALTSVRNKSAFDIHLREIQARITDPNDCPEFAVGIFDCDNLKTINDTYGHEKGDMYLKNSSHLICRVFQYSPVFRIGGDEFAVILQNEEYRNRETLMQYFVEKSAEICAFAEGPWEEVRVAMGIAVYDPSVDHTVDDVIRRADRLMYKNKRERKNDADGADQ